ncbi:hypothetical protein Salat_2797800 [Sesamum alatum]|uniref:DUF4283 domain-containing protein n=1 Tax=Sesamum alatum TaxID=300844 RepID=A0AAE1XKZ2_9LAMI|nr:hypothetical protein Salat_2797800 [Sesamum alatum]
MESSNSLCTSSSTRELYPPPKPPDINLSHMEPLSFKAMVAKEISGVQIPINDPKDCSQRSTQADASTQQPPQPILQPLSSYKNKLLQSSAHFYFPTWIRKFDTTPDFKNQTEATTTEENTPILKLSKETIDSIRKPWKQALIIKTTGLATSNSRLPQHLHRIWKAQGPITITDLGLGCYIARFNNPEDYFIALAGGPWFFQNHYLAISQWFPNFRPSTSSINSMVTWIQLPKLPIEYYDFNSLFEIGKLVGRPIKVDYHTGSISRGRYARVCVEIDTSNPLPSSINMGHWNQPLVYELKVDFCHSCGVIGHQKNQCSSSSKTTPTAHTSQDLNQGMILEQDRNSTKEWLVIKQRPRRKIHNTQNNASESVFTKNYAPGNLGIRNGGSKNAQTKDMTSSNLQIIRKANHKSWVPKTNREAVDQPKANVRDDDSMKDSMHDRQKIIHESPTSALIHTQSTRQVTNEPTVSNNQPQVVSSLYDINPTQSMEKGPHAANKSTTCPSNRPTHLPEDPLTETTNKPTILIQGGKGKHEQAKLNPDKQPANTSTHVTASFPNTTSKALIVPLLSAMHEDTFTSINPSNQVQINSHSNSILPSTKPSVTENNGFLTTPFPESGQCKSPKHKLLTVSHEQPNPELNHPNYPKSAGKFSNSEQQPTNPNNCCASSPSVPTEEESTPSASSSPGFPPGFEPCFEFKSTNRKQDTGNSGISNISRRRFHATRTSKSKEQPTNSGSVRIYHPTFSRGASCVHQPA